jgi:hypothetical protein
MKIRRIQGIQYCPYIRTEETIFELMERDKHLVSDDYELMCVPLAHLINTLGIAKTNQIIESLQSTLTRVFVCQHIHVQHLIFRDNDIVFSPHSTTTNRFISIPHYAVNTDTSLMSDDRYLLFSFIGSTTTHWTRKKIVELYENCFDSGKHWGLETNDTDFRRKYIEMLGNSDFSLCPRGTGISSVRTFESMSMGTFPVFISDGYEPPMKDIIDWNRISISIPEDSVDIIDDVLSGKLYDVKYIFDNDHIFDRIELLDTYNKYLSNDNLHMSIIYTL